MNSGTFQVRRSIPTLLSDVVGASGTQHAEQQAVGVPHGPRVPDFDEDDPTPATPRRKPPRR